jgi:hypothetical protein
MTPVSALWPAQITGGCAATMGRGGEARSRKVGRARMRAEGLYRASRRAGVRNRDGGALR